MINVEARMDRLGNYVYLKCEGHADSDVYGKDLVCAGVSCITTGLCNYLLKEYSFFETTDGRKIENMIRLERGFCEIEISDITIMQNDFMALAVEQLRTMERQFPQYIIVNEERNE